MIIGLTGKNAAGKGETAKYLMTKGFEYHSLSDALRDEAAKLNIAHTRDNLIKLGNELRKKYGAGFLSKKTSEKIINQKNFSKKNFFVVDSIRNPEEINELKKNSAFILVAVDAPIEIRFERMQKRGRYGDAKTLEELKSQEEKENLKTATNQQLDKCIEMADYIISNEDTLERLFNSIDNLLGILYKKNHHRR